MIRCYQVSELLAFHLGELTSGTCHLKLKVYPTFILQLTTLSLLMSFSSAGMSVLPAMTSPAPTETLEVEVRPLYENVKSEDYQPISDSKNVEKFIEDYFADIPIMAKIAKCESRNRHLDKNGQVLKGEITPLDRGVMQINLHYHEETAKKLGLDVHKLDDNVAYARYLYEKQGAKPWMSSSKCWSKTASSEIAKK
jgi:hypothetical protein